MSNAIFKNDGTDSSSERRVSSEEGAHPFGGCQRLRKQYSTIGAALITLEHYGSFSLVQRGASAEKIFREEVTFTPVEVLESYFDDLLDPEVSDERLSIALRSWGQRVASNLVSILGLFGAMLSGLYAATLGTSLSFSFFIALALAVPFATMLYLSAGGSTRRLRFAQVLSREISRRRGSPDRLGIFSGATLRLRDFLSPSPSQSQPAARIAVDLVH